MCILYELLPLFHTENTNQWYCLLMGQASGTKASRNVFSELSLIPNIDKIPSFG